MEQIYVIGRTGNQPFKIASESVHGEHAKITITEHGKWILEDLKGENGNGTYIQDEYGEFHRVYRVSITPDTIIRLANGGHRSYTFMAHRVLASENDFSYEFKVLSRMYKKLQEQEKINESMNVRNRWIERFSTFITLVSCCIIEKITNSDWIGNLKMPLMMFAPTLAGLLLPNGNVRIKRLKEQRLKTIVCPGCGRPLSDFDVNNMKCSICKAK